MHLFHLALFFVCWLGFFGGFFALNTKPATLSVNKNISIEKHSSLKPHFTLTILPHSSPVLHFAAFWSPLHIVKVERCTNIPVKHCFLKFRIVDRLFVLLKSRESLKVPKELLTGCTDSVIKSVKRFRSFVSENYSFFFMSKYLLSSKLCISLILEKYCLLQSSDSFSTKISYFLDKYGGPWLPIKKK